MHIRNKSPITINYSYGLNERRVEIVSLATNKDNTNSNCNGHSDFIQWLHTPLCWRLWRFHLQCCPFLPLSFVIVFHVHNALRNCIPLSDRICQRLQIIQASPETSGGFRCCFDGVLIKLSSAFKEIVSERQKNLASIVCAGVTNVHDLITWNSGHQMNNSSCLLMSKFPCHLIVDCLVFDVLIKKHYGAKRNGMTWYWINLCGINLLPSL